MATEESSKLQQSKWKGKVCAELKCCTADQVWPLVVNFFNLHKFMPTVGICQLLEGISGQPGCIRYCTTTTTTTSHESESKEKKITMTLWFKERLLDIDPVERSFSDEITENNMGINSCIAYWKVLELSSATEGYQIEWSYMTDPMEGFTFEGFLSFIQNDLQVMVQSLEDALCTTTTPTTSL